MVRPLTLLCIFDNPNCAWGPLLMYLSRVKECQAFENKWTISIFHCNFISVYREHFEISRLHLTEKNNKPEDWNRNILGGKFSKNLWPQVIAYLWLESMTIYGKIKSFQGKLEISLVIFSYKFSNTLKVLNHSVRKWFKSSNLNW